MYFNRFDIAEAYYIFASEWHDGLSSPTYAIFGRLHNIGFRPSTRIGKRSLSENGRFILSRLIKKARRVS